MARFSRRARLLKPGEFEAAFKRGTRHTERWLTAVSVANQTGAPRLGLAIAKKVLPLAVQRNRLKRKIRESFRNHQDRLLPLDTVILARPGCAKASAADIDRSLERLWKRIAASSPESSAR